jgi:hypothetical protein
MATRFTLTRHQLQEFIPNYQAVLTFENLIKYVNDNSPEGIAIINETLTSLQTQIKTNNAQIASLNQTINDMNTNLSLAFAGYQESLSQSNDLQLLIKRR